MSLKGAHNIGLHLVIQALAEVVAIEKTSSATESVLLVLEIVILQVVNDSPTHMGMILAWTKRGSHDGTHFLVEVGTKEPAGSENNAEKQEDQRNTLLGILDEWGMQMHVVLRREIVIQNCVNVLKLHKTGLLIGLAELGVRFVEVTSSHSGNLGHLSESSRTRA